MGMTIEKAITEVQQQKLDYQEFWEEYKNEHIEALDMAMSTMRKYQKIQKIVSDFREYQKGISCGFGGATYMQMVSEVVEDGNDD